MASGGKMFVLPPLSTVTRSSESLIERIKEHQEVPKSPSSSSTTSASGVGSGVFFNSGLPSGGGSPPTSPEFSDRKLPTIVKTISTAQKIKEGYLKRREKGMITTSWKRVLCVIRPEKPGVLTIHANDKRHDKDATFVQLQKAPVLVFNKDNAEGKFIFDVTPLYGEKEVKDVEILLESDSSEDRNLWLDALEDHGAVVKRPIKEGWLLKTGSGMKKWYKRYFVLHQDNITYYKNSPYEKATGTIALPGTAEIEIDEIDGLQHLFYVAENGDEGTRRYYIRAENESDRYDWVCTLIDLLAGRRTKMNQDSVKEGYLFKSSSNMKIWAKRYFVLTSAKMLYYKKFGDLEAAGEIEIAGSSEVEIENDLTRPHMFSVAKSGDSDERKYCMCARNGKERAEWIKTIKELQADKATRVNKSSLMEGYLNKCSTNQKKWSKRYFILLSDRLQYYKKREDPLPAGEIELTGDVEVEGENADETRPHMLSLQKTGDEGERQYLMTAKSDAERAEWINSIQTIIDTKRVRIHPESLREGYLFKSGSRMTHWTKRFFVLLEDRMLYFKKKHDRDPAGEISLPGGAEVERADGMGHDHMFYVARNGDEGERKYYIKTKTSSQRNDWMKSIQIILTKKKSIVHGNSVKEGYLYKCNVNMKHWTKRYFALFEDKLLYYKKKDDKQEAGEILLPGGAIVEIASEQGRLHMFSIAANGDEAERKFLLVCRDNPERASWMSSISEIIAKKDWKRDVKSVKEGYLLKSGSKGTFWSKRYFILYSDKLLYYKRKHDAEPAGTIEMPPGAQCDEEDGKADQPNLFYVAKNGDEETRKYYIRAKDDIERSDWVDCINELLEQKDAKTDPKSIKEGHLLKKGGLMGMGWKQHYFVLLPKELKWFKGRDEKVAEGVTAVDKTINPSVDFESPNSFSLMEAGKKQVYQCKDDNDRESWAMTLKHASEGHVEDAKKSATARSKNEVSPAELEAERTGQTFIFPEGLRDKWEMSIYKKFEQEQFTAENINYYEAVIAWKKLFTESPVDDVKIAEEGGKIYKEYVMENSPSEVNIISTLRIKCALIFEGKEALEAKEKGGSSTTTLGLDFDENAQTEKKLDISKFKGKLTASDFDEVTTVVIQLMNTNSFYRFKKSKLFDQLLARRVREKRKATKVRIAERRDLLKKKEAGLIDELPPMVSPSSPLKKHDEDDVVPPPDTPPPPSPPHSPVHEIPPPPPPESPLSRGEPVWKLLRSKGRVYYSNVRTRETTWTPPTTGTIWEKLKTPQGKVYYLDVLKKSTQWSEPPELAEARAIHDAKRQRDADRRFFPSEKVASPSQAAASAVVVSPPLSPRVSGAGASTVMDSLSLSPKEVKDASGGSGQGSSRATSPSPRASTGSVGGLSPMGKMLTPLPLFDSSLSLPPPAASSSSSGITTIVEREDAETEENTESAGSSSDAAAHPPPPEEEESKVPLYKLIMTKDKKIYYVNVANKHSQWNKPEVGDIYQRLKLSDERIYYLNVKTNTTSWTKPHPDFD